MTRWLGALAPLLLLACGPLAPSTSSGLEVCFTAADCTGALPMICPPCPPNRQCSSFACVGGLCQVEYCTPYPCTSASDCSGVLPTYCQVCADGSTACPHWVCSSGSCDVGVCP